MKRHPTNKFIACVLTLCYALCVLLFNACGDSGDCSPCNDMGYKACIGNISASCDGECWQPQLDCGDLYCLAGYCVASCGGGGQICPSYTINCETYAASEYKATGCCEDRCCTKEELMARCPESAE